MVLTYSGSVGLLVQQLDGHSYGCPCSRSTVRGYSRRVLASGLLLWMYQPPNLSASNADTMTPFPSGSNPGLGLASKISRMFTLENSFTSAIHYKNCSQLATKHLGSINIRYFFFLNQNITDYLYRGPLFLQL